LTYKEYIEQLGIGSLNTIPKNSLSPIWRNNITRLNEQNFATLYSSLNNNFLNTINPVIDAVNGLARVVIGTAGQKYKFTYNNVTGRWEYELADNDSTSEIFNAYPPLQEKGKDIFNIAIAEFTSSSGKNTQSGSKAFLITACNQQEKTFTLDGVEGLEAGDIYSISASGYANVEDIAEIVEINGNVVKVEHLPVEDGIGYGNAASKSDVLPENFPQGLAAPYFRITAKPNIGTQTIGEAASAFGKETIAEMNTSFVTGRGSKSLGKYGVAMGNKNTAYYSAAAIGGDSNKAFGKTSAIIGGSSNKTNGYADFILGGQNNETSGGAAFATGSWNKVSGFNAAAFGLYNESHGKNDFVTGYRNIVNGYCAAAFGLAHNIKGKGNFATGQGSGAKEGAENCFITGQSNLAENAAGCILAGLDNAVVGESVENKILQGVMLGRSNKVTGHYGVAAGYNNVANTQSVALGVNNVADVWRAFALGTGLKAKYMDQVVVGGFNVINGNAAFIVGNGTSDTSRSNAFVVNKDGSAEVGRQGTKDLSVATIKDLNEKVSSVYRYRGSVANKEALPTTDNVIGDVYNTEDSGMNYGWNGTTWDALGSEVDQSYQPTSIKAQSGKAVAEAIDGKQDTLVSGTNIKTINNQSILGSGNLDLGTGSSDFESYTSSYIDITASMTMDGLYVAANDITLQNVYQESKGNTYKILKGTHFAIGTYDNYRCVQTFDIPFKDDQGAGLLNFTSAKYDKNTLEWSGTATTSIAGLYINKLNNSDVDTSLSYTSNNPVQNNVITTQFNKRTPYLLSNLTFDVATATAGWYYATNTVKFTNGKLADPATDYYTAAITNGNSVVFSVMHYNNRAVVELLHGGFFNYYNGASISQPKDNVLILDYDDGKELWYSTHYADLGTISEDYRAKDEVNSSLDVTTPTIELNQPSSSQNKNIVYQYDNILTSLTITATSSAGEHLTLDQSIRLIFKATSSTTITVPSGLYFRGDDCNDSYVFIPQDNKVYDIIITYDGFNYNGIVVGTPATR
jgi:hypothetical protein